MTKYQAVVRLKEGNKFGYDPNKYLKGYHFRFSCFDTEDEAIKKAKELWGKEIKELYVRTVTYGKMKMIQVEE